MDVEQQTIDHRTARITRLMPLAGVAFAVLSIAGNLTIGPFPDESTSPGRLAEFYRVHHANVAAGGRLLEWSAVFFALFAVGLAARVRTYSPVIASLVLVGAAVDTVADGFGGAVYSFLGGVGGDGHLSAAALQAVHSWGAAFGMGAGAAVFTIGVATAAALSRSVPAWLGWSALVLGVAQLTPVGFLASMLFLAWAAVAGVVLTVRPTDRDPVVGATRVGAHA
ncbi:MAG: hypothetical protein QOE01_1557 [Actinomycetota bacterium]|jgi:hypothetical protein|nr:hypothetical protein [Actinomycetota bacterium]